MKVAAGAGGHSKKAPGARKYIDEYTEDRKVIKAFVKELESRGIECVNCSNEKPTQSQELAEECRLANKSGAGLFIAFHFNAASTTSGTRGTEVWYHTGSADGKSYAKKASDMLADALGLKDRGAKATTGLYVLNHTEMTAILVEVCFVDAKGDVNAYKKLGADGVAKAVADALFGKKGNASSAAKKYTAYKVDATNGLNLRKGPGTKYARVGGIADGEVVQVESINSGWAKTRDGSYCSSKHLRKCTKSTPYVVTASKGLNFRTGAGTENSRTRTVDENLRVSFYGERDGWMLSTKGDWASKAYLDKLTKKTVDASGGLNCRKGRGTGYAKTRLLKDGSTVYIRDTVGGWSRTQAGDYCCSKYLK